jgi:hypothetical protein
MFESQSSSEDSVTFDDQVFTSFHLATILFLQETG